MAGSLIAHLGLGRANIEHAQGGRGPDRAMESRDPVLAHLAVGPQWDGLRSDPSRFGLRLERMGLNAVPRPSHVRSRSATATTSAPSQ